VETMIQKADFIRSIADAFQYISYFHPPDFVAALAEAHELEESPAAKDAIAQILTNSRLCAEGRRPICQDTGIATVVIDIGMDVRWDTDQSIADMVNEGVRTAYNHDENPLRASVVTDPLGERRNTGDNTPAVIHIDVVPGSTVDIICAAKGGGSENKAKLAMLNPSDSIVDWVLETVPKLGAGWCPPGMLGLGIGGSPEKAMLMAKRALMAPIDIQQLQARGASDPAEALRLELHEKVNALGIGAQGLGGLTTVVDVKVEAAPTHAASLPVALIPQCAANRHVHFTLDGSGPADLVPPQLDTWPDISWSPSSSARRVNLDSLTRSEMLTWAAGERLLLSGKLLTGRDAAHKRMVDMIARGEELPIDLAGRMLYYVGPVDAVGDEAVGPAGPTTSTRMDKFTDTVLAHTGLLGMIGKAERGSAAIESIKNHRACYMIAVGGAAYLVSRAIRSARVVAFEDLGMEAIHEFEVIDMPVTVAVDTTGASVHSIGVSTWRQRLAERRSPQASA
jgi:fumarate hydratase class I